jgi:uracil-DNA glycosylase
MSKLLTTVDLEETKRKLYERLKPSGWGDKLKTFIMSQDFDKILDKLLQEAKEGQRFTPVLKQVFRAFEECPYKDLKVVMIGQDPYPYAGVADGIAFSCSNDEKVQASLRYMFKEIEDTVYPEGGYVWDPDLKKWSNQGILVINIAFTTTIGKVGQHYALWQPFMAFLLDTLMYSNPGLIYVFMGKKAQEWADSIPENNYKIFTTHPASAAHANAEKWDSGDVFNKVSEILQSTNKETIVW